MNQPCEKRILSELYEQYYVKNGTQADHVTSHWRHYQEKLRVHIANGRIQNLSGAGFGDFENPTLASRFISWLTITNYLWMLPQRRNLLNLMRIAIPLSKRMGLAFSYDSFRQVCTLDLLLSHLHRLDAQKSSTPLRVINIGDGYGFLSALIMEVFPSSSICLVDLGKILFFQAYYCGKAHPSSPHLLVNTPVKQGPGFVYCPAEHLDCLDEFHFEIAVNIASMQEMNEQAVGRYFQFLRQHLTKDNLFYCCNREEKTMIGGECSRFDSYPWIHGDYHWIDDHCPWHHFFFSTKSAKEGPKLFSFRVPFINYFEGSHRHRLTSLKRVGISSGEASL